jgi:hypothetical protein
MNISFFLFVPLSPLYIQIDRPTKKKIFVLIRMREWGRLKKLVLTGKDPFGSPNVSGADRSDKSVQLRSSHSHTNVCPFVFFSLIFPLFFSPHHLQHRLPISPRKRCPFVFFPLFSQYFLVNTIRNTHRFSLRKRRLRNSSFFHLS